MSRYMLIAGHGNGDPGACANGQQEWKLARKFNDLLAKYLKQLKQKVTVYNSDGTLYTTKDMFQQTAKNKGLWSFRPDNRIVVENHLDSFKGESNGTSTLIEVSLSADKYDKAMNKALSNFFKNRGIKKRSDLLNMNVAAVRKVNYRLNELCFISNKNDVTKFVKEMDKIAREMAEELTGKSLAPKKVSEAIGKAYFMRKDKKECWLYIYPWDIFKRKLNNKDRYAHVIDIHTKGRAIYNTASGKRVNTWKGDVEDGLYYIDTPTEKKVTRQP